MKKSIAFLTASLLLASTAFAGVKTVGKGSALNFDPASIPVQHKKAFQILETKCAKCHTMERTVVALQTGLAPITSQPFDKGAIKGYGVKMLRKPDSGMSKEEIKQVVDLLNYLADEAAK